MKKNKKTLEPEYIMSELNTPMINYKVYYMSPSEKVKWFLIAFIVGGIVGITFYGGQFRDSDGLVTDATTICNIIIFTLAGFGAVRFYLPVKTDELLKNRRNELNIQFKAFLEALATSLSSGMNMQESLSVAHEDLKLEFSDNAYIVVEVAEMVYGIQNNIAIEDMLISLGERSQIEDIKNFGNMFAIAYRAGGDLKEIVRRTSSLISEKIEINAEIETAISSNKTQFNIMMVIPVVMILLLRNMSSEFAASFSTVPGVISITLSIGIFVGAYKVGQKILDVKG